LYYVKIQKGGFIWQYLKEKDSARDNLLKEKEELEEEQVSKKYIFKASFFIIYIFYIFISINRIIYF